MAPMAA